MPRVLKRPKFAPGDQVVACEPFSGTGADGVSFVCNPSEVLRGDDPRVRRFPWMFRREGDTEALREYHAAVLAEQPAENARQKAAEREQRAKEHERAMRLADKLEAAERRRREKERNEMGDWWQDEGERKRLEEDEKRAEEDRIRMIAEAEVARRLAGVE